MTEERIEVPEIHCEHCKHSIEGAVAALDGVERAEVDIDARAVTVRYDETLVALPRIHETIEDQGYEVPR